MLHLRTDKHPVHVLQGAALPDYRAGPDNLHAFLLNDDPQLLRRHLEPSLLALRRQLPCLHQRQRLH